MAFGLLSEQNFQHMTHFDNAYALEPPTTFITAGKIEVKMRHLNETEIRPVAYLQDISLWNKF